MTEVQCLQKADEWDFLLYVWKVEKTNEQKLGNRNVEILISPIINIMRKEFGLDRR